MSIGSFLRDLRIPLLTVLLAALAVRIHHLYSILHSPIADAVVLDARYYFTEAGRLLGYFSDAGEGIRFMNIGYPYVIAAICSIAGYHVSAVLWVQVFIGSVTCGMITASAYLITQNRRVALIAGLVSALYTGGIFYDALLLTPSVINGALSAALFFMIVGVKEQSWLSLFAAGLCIGFASLMRANSLLLLIVWGVVLIVMLRRVTPKASMITAALLAGGMLVTGPVIVYNGMEHDEWVILSANGGMNFWMGNHQSSTGMYTAPEFVGSQSVKAEEEAFLMEARKRSGDSTMTLSSAGSFWRDAALRDITEDPLQWVTLIGKKMLMSINHYEIQTNTAVGFIEQFSSVLQVLPVRFAVLFPFGIAGLLFLRYRNRTMVWVLSSFAAVYLATPVLFFVSGEYRHPASIALCIGAAIITEEMLTTVAAYVRRPASFWTDKRRSVISLAAGIVLLPVVMWNVEEVERISDPFYSYTNYAQAHYRKIEQMHTPSMEEFQRATQLLQMAKPKPHQQLILWEVLCRTHFFAAVSYGNTREAKQALIVAQQIFSQNLEEVGPWYDQQFLVFLFFNVPALVREILNDERLKHDQEVRQFAVRSHQLFMSNTTIHPYVQQRYQ